MRSSLQARLVNGPFEDPGVFVGMTQARRAFLFDLGDLAALSVRELLRVHDVFVSHTHMDHFAGFDWLLRVCLGRDMALRLFGPPGLIEQVGHKLRAYSWNLLEGYENELSFAVAELHPGGYGRRAVFRLRDGFARADEGETRRARNGHRGEGLILSLPVTKIRVGDGTRFEIRLALMERYELLGLRVGQRVQEHAIDD